MTHFNFVRWILIGTFCLYPWRGLQAQVITSFSPGYGSSGDTVTLHGSGFLVAPIQVNFWNGIPVSAPFANSDTIATVTVPPGISTGPISVRYSGGSWHYSPDIFIDVGPGPFIESVDPDYGAVNDPIYIHGVHFAPGSVVKFGGVTASSIPNGAGDQITAYVPAVAAGDVALTVTASGITYTNPEPFTVVGSGPYIEQFTPMAGSESAPVTLTGLHFTFTSSVKFNGISALFDTVVNDKQMTAYAPNGVTTGPITVTASGLSYTTTTPFYGPISLTGFSPSSGPTGTQVVISGTNFTNAISVKFVKVDDFTAVNASFVVNNNNKITATVPDDAPTGILVVATPAGSFPTTSNFVVKPMITGFTPVKGAAGTPVQIDGTRLVDSGGGKPTVKFNNVPSSTISSWGPHRVVATAPASSSGYIALTTADGTSTTTNRFYYPPRIDGFTPDADPPGTVITINGQSLIDASSVLFNGVPSTNVTVPGNTSIHAEVPVGVTTGPITVTTPGGTTNSTDLYYAVPVITAFSPSSGGPGTSVTVFGTSFQGTTSVKFNGTNANFNNVTATQLKAVVPSGATTGPITVTAPAGTATSAEAFVVPQISDLRVNTFTNVPSAVTVGGDSTLTLVVANDGPNTATDVSASVNLAPGQHVKSTVLPSGVTVNTNGNPVVFDIGTLSGSTEVPGYSQVSMVLTAQLPGLTTNTVTLSSSTFDPEPGNNTAMTVTTVLAPPNLNIAPEGTNQVRVAWPSSLAGYVLQSAPTLTNNPAWTNVSTTPVIEGEEKVVTEPSTGTAKYYRLKK